MAETRKLLAEMEKVFRKVDEGVEEFEATMAKMHEANSENQREKFQDDLKKEIKKLQRLRDQIKGWQNSREVKDKDKLTNYRKLIESHMEIFKGLERENKTKPHSKQGLNAEEKLDPREKERSDTMEWMKAAIATLNTQCDSFESSIENLIPEKAKKKNSKVDKDKQKQVDELKHKLEMHKFHVQKLELIMRLLNNDNMETGKVNALKEEVMYYVDQEGNDELDTIYDDLNLHMAEIAQKLGSVTQIGTLEETENASETSTNPSGSPVPSPSPVAKETPPSEQLGMESGRLRHASGGREGMSPVGGTEPASRTTRVQSGGGGGIASRSTPATPLKLTSQTSMDSALSSPPPPASATPPPLPTIPYNVAAGTARAPPPPLLATSSTGTKANTTGFFGFGNNNNNTVSAPNTATKFNCPPESTRTPTNDVPMLPRMTPVKQQTSESPGPMMFPASMGSMGSDASGDLDMRRSPPPMVFDSPIRPDAIGRQQSNAMNGPGSIEHHLRAAAAGQDAETRSGVLSLKSIAEQAIDGQNSDPMSMQRQDLFGSNSSSAFSALLRPSSSLHAGHDAQEALIPPSLGASPLGKLAPSTELAGELALLEPAIARMPMSMDSEKLRPFLQRNPCGTPSYYPQVPPPLADTIEYFHRLQPETLFFIFYYMEGTKAQYLAAKALKKQSWRFHKKYLMWFQRHEEPKCITDDYEQGTYVYFDFEKWQQRKKDGFTFEYRFLEDRELT